MLGGSLEENVLTALVHSDTLAPHIAVSIKPSDFSVSAYRHIAAGALDFLERHQRAPRAHIADVLEQEIKRGQEGRFILQVLQQIDNLAPSLNEDYVRANLDRHIETQRLITAVNNAADLLHDGNLEQAREMLRAPNLLAPKDAPGVWLRDSEAWLAFLREQDEAAEFSSGIEVLDDRGVRPARGELYAMLAAAGMGKSWFLVNAGVHNVLHHRRNVLHITLENSLAVTLERYTQCLLTCTRDEARRIELPVLEARDGADTRRIDLRGSQMVEGLRELGGVEVARRLERYQHRGQLLVKHWPMGMLTMGMLNAYLDSLEQVEHFTPDLILLDYMTLMHLRDDRDYRISVGQLARNLRGMASLRDCALVTAVQANREASGKRWVSSSNTAEDWSLVGTCDTLLTYSQTGFERDRKVARVTVAKARNAADRWTAYVAQSYEIGQFALDSCYHSQLKDQMDEGEDPSKKGAR